MENSNQVCKQRLPDTKFEFMHKINDHCLGDIEILSKQSKSFAEGILSHARSNHKLTAEGNLAHNGWYGGCHLEQTVNASTCNGMTNSIDQILRSLYLLVKVLANTTRSSEIRVRNLSHPIKPHFRGQTAWTRAEPIVTDCCQEDPGYY